MQCPICNEKAGLKYQFYDDRYGAEGFHDVFQCKQCEHIFVDVTLDDEQISELYSTYYPRMSITELNMPSYRGFSSWLNGASQACQYVLPSTKVLDVGCGAGQSLLYLKSIGCDAIGLDVDKNVLPLAKKYGLDIRIGVLDKDLFKNETFDYILMDQVIEHIKKPIAILKEAKALLKPSGKVVLSTPFAGGAGRRMFGSKWVHWHVPYHVTFFSKRSLAETVQKAGFKIERVARKTSSEWIYYQYKHLLFFPEQGQPSYFWGQHRARIQTNLWKKIINRLIDYWHKLKIDHLVTRCLDSLALGDNIIVILSNEAYNEPAHIHSPTRP
jgi:2-polyprenyl-3-methyl-5-hydroxy-6-metoxy-1,4-benzoquinol methylase